MNPLVSTLKKTLLKELKVLKAYGIDQIGYRYFLKDGRSFGLPTSGLWYKRNSEDSFFNIMKCFLSHELLKLEQHNYHYVSRSSDHKKSEYIEYLKMMKMDNSVGVYKFNKERIDSFFIFMRIIVEKKR